MPQVSFVLAATETGPLIVNRLDAHLTEHGYFGVGAQLLSTGRYDQQDIDGLSGVLTLRRRHHGDGVIALDVGANIGTHAIAWAKLMHYWGKVFAVEAQERVYYALAGNLALNNLFNARALCSVVGAEEGWLRIPVLDHEKAASFGSLELIRATAEEIGQEPVETQRARMTTIDEIVAGTRVDLIKLDIEGMEPQALEGGRETIDRCHPALFIEWTKCGEDRLRGWLDARGYVIHKLGMNLLALHRDDPISAHVNPRSSEE